MKTIYELLKYRYELNQKRGYKKFYIAVDFHDTVCIGSRSVHENLGFVSENCMLSLQMLSDMDDVVLIMWTATYLQKWEDEIDPWLKMCGVKIQYLNENPECPSNSYSNFMSKFYFDVGLDDKFGFEICDWKDVLLFAIDINKNKESQHG